MRLRRLLPIPSTSHAGTFAQSHTPLWSIPDQTHWDPSSIIDNVTLAGKLANAGSGIGQPHTLGHLHPHTLGTTIYTNVIGPSVTTAASTG